jgi:hypothetical protein
MKAEGKVRGVRGTTFRKNSDFLELEVSFTDGETVWYVPRSTPS